MLLLLSNGKAASLETLKKKKLLCLAALLIVSVTPVTAGNGYRLWMKYDKINSSKYLDEVQSVITAYGVAGNSPTVQRANEELRTGLTGLLGKDIPKSELMNPESGLLLGGTPRTLKLLKEKRFKNILPKLGKEGYFIQRVKTSSGYCIVIGANEDIGVLYGVFHFLRLLQTYSSLDRLRVESMPKIQLRMLNHWDNLNGSVGRGYAGRSLWKWDQLPEKTDPRYRDYARANASLGINAVALNNVNADPRILTGEYLKKVAALADIFRPYGIKVFLSANFASPKILGGLPTADPLDKSVERWWKNKADEIYRIIPDFGGFLVKADAEGQPGPGEYHRTHAEGANMMASALAPHGGILIWRAFVYAVRPEVDRAGMAYDEFKGLDGEFKENVLLQVKNGPLDFQPREPFSPLFGAMPHTNEMMEFQITQEYLGHSDELVYLAPLFKETLESDTYAGGRGATVARILDGSIEHQPLTGMAGVANTGSDSNWTGYIFGQANWYAFGRLAWDHELSSGEIADEWIRMTLTHHPGTIQIVRDLMLNSWEDLVNYQTPLGLATLINWHHNGPDPAFRMFYHRADTNGLGFDRTRTGSNVVSQYFPPVRDTFNHIHTCPEKFLTWFHHVPWDFKMASGRIFWEELCYKYFSGVKGVEKMQQQWELVKGQVDPEIFTHTKELLAGQEKKAKEWRRVCLDYFKEFSRRPIPDEFQIRDKE